MRISKVPSRRSVDSSRHWFLFITTLRNYLSKWVQSFIRQRKILKWNREVSGSSDLQRLHVPVLFRFPSDPGFYSSALTITYAKDRIWECCWESNGMVYNFAIFVYFLRIKQDFTNSLSCWLQSLLSGTKWRVFAGRGFLCNWSNIFCYIVLFVIGKNVSFESLAKDLHTQIKPSNQKLCSLCKHLWSLQEYPQHQHLWFAPRGFVLEASETLRESVCFLLCFTLLYLPII